MAEIRMSLGVVMRVYSTLGRLRQEFTTDRLRRQGQAPWTSIPALVLTSCETLDNQLPKQLTTLTTLGALN